MSERGFGFDDFARKWVPPFPAWLPAAERPTWPEAESEDERRQGYMETMERSGGDAVAFDEGLGDGLKRAAAAGVPILTILDGLLADPRGGEGARAALLFQRVFGVPASRALFIASWKPTNRRPEAVKILERVVLCVEDARRAGLWAPPPGPEAQKG